MRSRSMVLAGTAVLAWVGGCHRPKHYETTVELSRISVARRDDAGRPVTVDVEFRYAQCPGVQRENVRGDANFGACITKHAVGDRVNVKLVHQWSDEGQYEWKILEVADCPRPPDPRDKFSFATVRECDDWIVSGAKVGFQCNIAPQKELLAACPWFGLH